jgi:O-Antigen ligase
LATALRDLCGTARQHPAFALYLAALAALGFKWLSPLDTFYARAIWSDLLVAAAAGLWLGDLARRRERPTLRIFHLALGLYLAAGVLSLGFAANQELGAKNVLLMAELAVIAILTSEFASDPKRLTAIVLVIALVALYTAILAFVALALFYAGVETSLLGAYGEQFVPSDNYARVAAGFASPPLLGSFCIFASAVVARQDADLPAWLRPATQAALAAGVLLTLSRAILGFAAALAIRAALAPGASRRARFAAFAFVVASIVVIGALTLGRLHLDPTRPSTVSYEVPDPHNRREAFETSIETLGDHPIIGEGPGSLPGENRAAPFRAHLTPLNIAATMGIPALLAATFLLLTLWRNRRPPTPSATWSGLAGLGIDGLAQDIEHFRHVWVMIGLADADRGGPGCRGPTRSPPSPSTTSMTVGGPLGSRR